MKLLKIYNCKNRARNYKENKISELYSSFVKKNALIVCKIRNNKYIWTITK